PPQTPPLFPYTTLFRSEERAARFAACGHCFPAPEVSFDHAPALFQATDLRGNWANTQNAGDDREDHLLPLFAALAESARRQRTLCIRFVESLTTRRKKGVQAHGCTFHNYLT